MCVFNDCEDYPGTIPFFGYPANLEISPIKRNNKDFLLTITVPMGYNNIDDLAARAAKYFDGEIVSVEPTMVVVKADVKMISYTLLFSLRDNFMKI